MASIYEEFDFQDLKVGDYKLNENNVMPSGIFKLDWANVRSAVIYGLLSGLLAIILYANSIGDIFALNWHTLANAGVFGLLGSLVSIIKNLLTTNSGNFLGAVNTVSQ